MKFRNVVMCALLAASCLMGVTACGGSASSDGGNASSDGGASSAGSTAVAGDGKTGGNIDDVVLKDGDKIAVFEIEGYGTIKAKLYPDEVPMGVENFIKLADEGYYDGKTIHRVISDFMLQGGSLNGDGTGGEAAVNGGSFGIETNSSLRHFYGALCYANAMGTNTTQFYIVNNNKSQDISKIDTEAYRKNADEYDAAAEQMKELSADYANYYAFQADYLRTLASWAESASDEVKAKYSEVGGTPSLDGNYTVFGQVYEGFDVIDAISSAEVKENANGEVSEPAQDIIISKVYVTDYTEG